ncbi:MAG: Rieske 2Fe-2S domain-containing protein [Rhodocyclaceae bacterium]|nr:Rieske 2Fe-2S domain-containing protein [Rhodocyclaceae bacterium]
MNQRIRVCASGELVDGAYLRLAVAYDSEPIMAFVFRHRGTCLAFRNLCVHMPRELDCEKSTVFDASGRYLRCSMHGIVYDPLSGESMSEICNGKRLTAIELAEDAEGVWIVDRRVKALPGPR